MQKVLFRFKHGLTRYKTNMKIYLKKLILMVTVALAPVLASATDVNPTDKTSTTLKVTGTRDIVQEIINAVGLKPRFELRAADIENAAAVVYNGKRYILYNDNFLNKINNAVQTDWGGVSILAHEIGHHLNGHTLSRGGSNPGDELEADEFSGFVLRKMGASLGDAQAAISLLSEEQTSATHPGRRYRLAAISKGWNNAETQILASGGNAGDATVRESIARRSEPRTTATPARQQVSHRLDSQSILSKVTFSRLPQEQFYVTKQLNLVHVSRNGELNVMGKLARTNSKRFPYYFDIEDQPVFVTDAGLLVNEDGQRVGYLK
ncbi:membrane-binding protein [Pontibacter harenae]|uniref:membrane-binding protein n=1 Tax=Pontibacter harenae TaxID=2894083 RepID=UPI001E623269|nr:membrane-binding protein [Pontibacter harenae]MCC9166803.1 membrane-binding protein [Pontibacter harenae]